MRVLIPSFPFRRSALLLLGATLLLTSTPSASATGPPALEPASSGGLQSLDRALDRLSTHRRLLVLAAHPDDEDTRLLTYAARGLGGEAAYLSLSRGEGGQNLIGPELGLGLGLLRSRELLAARGIDGARQYFTRAYDFGYTRSLDETFGLWPRDILLEDTLRIVRRFKPQILVAIFPPTARAGHGQHQASGVIADQVVTLAGDPEAFPELADEGLHPWPVTTFYRSTFFDRDSTTHEIDLGAVEPFSGRSLFQIALQSRSQHRCQDMGLELPLGEATGRLAWVSGGEGADAEDIFAGIDTRPEAIAAPLPEGELKRTVAARLRQVGELATSTRAALSPADPGTAADPLLEIVRLLVASRDDLSLDVPAQRQVRELVEEKLVIAQEGLATAAQILADAITDRETVIPGGAVEARSIFWNAGPYTIEDLRVEALSPDGWRETGRRAPDPQRSFFATRVSDEQILEITVPNEASATIPYFLERPLNNALYDWSSVASELRGEPFQPPPLTLRFNFTLGGVPIALEREVVQRTRDQAYGEIRRPLRAVPHLEVTVEPELLVWPIGTHEAAEITVTVSSNADAPTEATLELAVPPGWPEPEPRQLTLDPRGRAVLSIPLQLPANLSTSRHTLEARATTANGERYAVAYPLVDYEHIRPTPRPRPAKLEISAAEIRLPQLGKVGYVRGAADRIPEFLRQIGVPVEVLDPATLAGGELDGYDALVIGPRAYEIDRVLLDANPRLLAWARAGGTLIVQYQQYQFVRGDYPPYPLEILRPHGRVTDETASVTLLDATHPLLTAPNSLGPADWDGWVQERGLYFAGTWDDAYTPLLEMADPDRDPERGALLVAELGEGHYVYTGLAFFRQLPAGVPGAFRLFANLLALGGETE